MPHYHSDFYVFLPVLGCWTKCDIGQFEEYRREMYMRPAEMEGVRLAEVSQEIFATE